MLRRTQERKEFGQTVEKKQAINVEYDEFLLWSSTFNPEVKSFLL